MHSLQQKILDIISTHDISSLTLRKIGDLIGVKHPQAVKYHLNQLEKKGLIQVDKRVGRIIKTSDSRGGDSKLITIPILGSADCGDARQFAEQHIEGYIKISSKFFKNKKNIFALRAIGSSMNQAKVKQTKTIQHGDYVLIDGNDRTPNNNDYVVSVIDGVCNIKKFVRDPDNEKIILYSESDESYPPIVIHPEDAEYMINGTVIDVIKNLAQEKHL